MRLLRSNPAKSLACGLACTLFAVAAVAQSHSIGTLGATLPAERWERQRLAPAFGDDQFKRVGQPIFMVVFELFALLEERTDFDQRLEPTLALLETEMTDANAGEAMEYERFGDLKRATRYLTGTISGVRLRYRLDLVSAGDGVGYLLMSWMPAPGTGLGEAIDTALAGFELPGPDSDWNRKTVPTLHEYAFGDWTVGLTFRDSVFREAASQPGERVSLEADLGELFVHLFLVEAEGTETEVIEQIKEAADRDGTFAELTRSELDLAVGHGLQVLLRSQKEPISDLAAAAIDLGDDRWLDVRMLSAGRSGHREELWRQLLNTLRVTEPRQVDAFPSVVAPPEPVAQHLGPAARRLLEASRLVATAPHTSKVLARSGGGFLVSTSQRIERRDEGADGEAAEPEVLYSSSDYITARLVPWAEQLFLVDSDSQVHRLDAGKLEEAGFEADSMVAAGEELMLSRRPPAETLLGLGALPRVGPAQLFARNADGEERPILQLPAGQIPALAAKTDGSVLVATSTEGLLSDDPLTFWLIEGASGSAAQIGRWERVDRTEPADDGWLVSGAPADGRRGVYRLDDHGQTELLLSGTSVGVSLRDGELTFVTERCLEPPPEASQSCVYRVEIETARQLGPQLAPFDHRALDRIGATLRKEGERWQTGGFPASRQDIADYTAAADRAAEALTGTHLPTTMAELAPVLDDLIYVRDLSQDGLRVLSVLLARALLDGGAEWLPSAATGSAAADSSWWVAQNAFAVGLSPTGAVRSILYDEDGWYGATAIVEQAEGRRILLGDDFDALRQQVQESATGGLEDLLRRAAVKELSQLLSAHADNLYLRRHVYEQLAAYGHRQSLAALAGARAASDSADAIDVVASLAVSVAELDSAEAAEAAVGQLRSAIERYPEEEALYLLLGAAYEQTARQDRHLLARRCYQKTTEIKAWGDLATAAREALERLDKEG